MPSGAENNRRSAALVALYSIHAEIDREADRLANKHAERLRCHRGCSACCLDDLTVTAVEAARIAAAHPELLETAEPRTAGGCAFLDEEGACRVYADRPSVCRSQGLPLRVFFENEEDEIEEHRDICPLNLEGGPPLDELDDSEFWLVGPFDLRLSAINDAYESEMGVVGASGAVEEARRVPLRSLFARSR